MSGSRARALTGVAALLAGDLILDAGADRDEARRLTALAASALAA